MRISRTFATLFCAVALMAIVTSQGRAAEGHPPYGPPVSLETAKKIAAGAIAYATSKNWRVAVAIVDTHGFLVYYERLDDTQTASAQIAVDKATSAAMFRRPTRVFEEILVDKGRTAILGLTGATPVTGGLPIVVDGKIVGGVGASGVKSAQDEEAAQAGLDALK